MDVKIQSEWKAILNEEFEKPYFNNLVSEIKKEIASGETIYPPGSMIFKAFELTPPDTLKVVIVGQDPYHNVGEAMGLSFSVPKSIRVPPSLKNIFKELKDDLGFDPPSHGDLSLWAEQGVLLLNSMLTVRKNKPGSHQSLGWHEFTDEVIRIISHKKEGIVFLLWGNYAKSKAALIDSSKHLVISAAHPSPLARGAFFGHKPFSQTNNYLESHGIEPINWQIR